MNPPGQPAGRGPSRRDIFAGAAALAVSARPAMAACTLRTVAAVPVTLAAGLPLVEVAIDGQPATMVLDTGADRTVIADTAIRALSLARDPWVGTALGGVGGVLERTANVLLRSFTLGGAPLRRNSLAGGLSLAVARLPGTSVGGRQIAGLLGGDFLSVYDLDLDLPAGRLGLVTSQGCAGAEPPWPVRHSALALLRPRPYTLLAPVALDGRTLLAQLDTGASVTLLTRKGMARLGLASGGTGSATARGIGAQALALQPRTFARLQLGALTLLDMTVMLGAPAAGYPFDAVLGTDILRARRLLISYATNRLLIADETA